MVTHDHSMLKSATDVLDIVDGKLSVSR